MKMKSCRSEVALKAGIIYLVAELFTRGISFFMTPVFARLLPPEVYADTKIFEAWVYLFAPILSVCVYQSVARAKFDFESKYEQFVSSMMGLMIFITAIVGVLATPFVNRMSILLGYSPKLLLLMLIYCLSYNCIQCLQISERQLMHYKSNVTLTVFAVLPSVAISVFFVIKYYRILDNQVLLSLRLLSFYIPAIIFGAVVIVMALMRGKKIIALDCWKYSLKYSAPLVLYSISTQILYQSDKIMVRRLCDARVTAILTMATTVGYIIDIFIHALDNAWRPWMFEKLAEEKHISIQNLWLVLLSGVGVMVFGISMLAPEVVGFLGGREYRESVVLIAPVLFGSLGNFVIITYNSYELFEKKTKFSGGISISISLLNLFLNYVFIMIFGYRAAAYTTIVSYFSAAILHGIYIKSFDKKDTFASKKTILMCLIVGVSVCFSIMMNKYHVAIRFLIVGIACAVWLRYNLYKIKQMAGLPRRE